MSASASQIEIESAVLAVLKSTPEGEIGLVTMPMLRAQVARHLSITEDVLQDKAAKTTILEAFQKFLLQDSNKADADEASLPNDSDEEFIDDVPTKKKRRLQSSNDSELKSSKGVSSEKALSKGKTSSSKTKDKTASSKTKDKTASSKTKSMSSANESQIERLKSYIFKCGVRKVWKKELEGLNGKQSIERLQTILTELGMDGRPTLEKCKEIRKRREFEAEMREIDLSNVIEGKRRNRSQTRPVLESSEEEREEEDDENATGSDSDPVSPKDRKFRSKPLDLRALGDPEESE